MILTVLYQNMKEEQMAISKFMSKWALNLNGLSKKVQVDSLFTIDTNDGEEQQVENNLRKKFS